MTSRSQKQQLILKKKVDAIVSVEQPEGIAGGIPARPGKRKNLKPITKSFDEAEGARDSDDGEVFLIPEDVEDIDMTPIKTSFYQYQTSQPMYAHPNLQFGLHWPSSAPRLPQSNPTQAIAILSQDHPVESALAQTTPTQAAITTYPPQLTSYPQQSSFTQPTPEMMYRHQQQIYQQIHNQQSYGPSTPMHSNPHSPSHEMHCIKLPPNPFSGGNDRYSPDLSVELMNPLPPLPRPVSEAEHLKRPNWADVINVRSSPATDVSSHEKDSDCSSDSPTTPIPGVDSPTPLSEDIQIIPPFNDTSPAPPDHADSEVSDNEDIIEIIEPVQMDDSRQITGEIRHVIETHFKGSLDHLRVFLDDETILLLYELIIEVKRMTPKPAQKPSKKCLLKQISPLLCKINKKLLLLEDSDDGTNISRTVLYESLEDALPPVIIKGKATPFSVTRTKGLLKCAMRKVHREELTAAEGALDAGIKEFCLLLEPGEQSEVWDDEIEKLYDKLIALKYDHLQLIVPEIHHKDCLEQYIARLIKQENAENQPVAWPSDCITLTKLLDQANKHYPLVGKPQHKKDVEPKKIRTQCLSELTDNIPTSTTCTTNQSTQFRPKYTKASPLIPTSPNRPRSTQVVHPQPKVLPPPPPPPPPPIIPIIPPHPYTLIPRQVHHPPVPVPIPIPVPIAAPHHFQNSSGYPDYNAVGRFLSIISPDRRRQSSEKSHRHRSKDKRKRSRSRSPSYRNKRRSSEKRRYRSSSSERDSRSSKRYRNCSHESARHSKTKKSRSERKRRGMEEKKKRGDALMEKRNMIKMKFGHHHEGKETESKRERIEKAKVDDIKISETDIGYLEKYKERNEALCKEIRELQEIERSMETLKDEEKKSLIHEQLKQLIDIAQSHGLITKEEMKTTLRDEIKELKEIDEINKRKRLRELRAVEDEIEEKKLLELESEVGGLEEEDGSTKDTSNVMINNKEPECDKQTTSEHKTRSQNSKKKEPECDKQTTSEHKITSQNSKKKETECYKQTTSEHKTKAETSKEKVSDKGNTKQTENCPVTHQAKLMKEYGDVKVKEEQVEDGWNVVLTVQGYVFEGVATTEIDAVEDASFKALLLAPYLMTQVKCAG